jgi:hypothetical protein
VRRLLAIALLVASSAARAEVVRDAPPDPPDDDDFWRELVEPHATEVNAITMDVQTNLLAPLEAGYGGDPDVDVGQRTRRLEIAQAELKHARKLAPENVVVLAQLGRVADELGNTRQALEALQAALDLSGADKASPDVTGELGAIYLRLGDLDAAIRYLRLAQASPQPQANGEALIDLSTALALRGEMSDGIDVLTSAVPRNFDFNNDQWGLAFALAVQYDRDDQRGAAFEVLDRLQGILQDNSYGQTMQSWLASVRLAPGEETHYYSALLYESLGDYTEARAEWALYAASGGAFRGRALEHVAAIDAERHAHPGVKPAPNASPLPPPPFHMHHTPAVP